MLVRELNLNIGQNSIPISGINANDGGNAVEVIPRQLELIMEVEIVIFPEDLDLYPHIDAVIEDFVKRVHDFKVFQGIHLLNCSSNRGSVRQEIILNVVFRIDQTFGSVPTPLDIVSYVNNYSKRELVIKQGVTGTRSFL